MRTEDSRDRGSTEPPESATVGPGEHVTHATRSVPVQSSTPDGGTPQGEDPSGSAATGDGSAEIGDLAARALEPVRTPHAPPPAFADGVDRRLEPGWIAASRYGGLIFWGIAGIAGLAVLTVVAVAGKIHLLAYVLLVGALFIAVAVALALAWMWPRWEHARAGYRILPDRIESWRGLVWRSRVSVPISRVQYTDVQQGPIQRRHGIATLSVHTAGSSNAEVSFPGLPPALANEVRDWLVGVTGSDAV
jgi:membrane protein YdbS with pleckstrin-like domain